VLLSDNIDALGSAVAALLNPEGADSGALVDVVADEVRRRRLQPPRSIWRAFKILAKRAAEEDRWVPAVAVKLSADPRWVQAYRRVRIRCGWCCTGYLVVRKRRDRRYRFAGCSNYTGDGCRFTIGSRAYARVKCEVVAALIAGIEPEHDYIQVEPKPRASNATRKRKSSSR